MTGFVVSVVAAVGCFAIAYVGYVKSVNDKLSSNERKLIPIIPTVIGIYLVISAFLNI